jgi:hypothetical protein
VKRCIFEKQITIKPNTMQPITYKLVNKDSQIGFDKMELVNIAEGQFWFLCHYSFKVNGKIRKVIDLVPFDNDEYCNVIKNDYKIVR